MTHPTPKQDEADKTMARRVLDERFDDPIGQITSLQADLKALLARRRLVATDGESGAESPD